MCNALKRTTSIPQLSDLNALQLMKNKCFCFFLAMNESSVLLESLYFKIKYIQMIIMYSFRISFFWSVSTINIRTCLGSFTIIMMIRIDRVDWADNHHLLDGPPPPLDELDFVQKCIKVRSVNET